jgi:uncharacterized protein Yka (UPF0111/DUF47 family)
MSDKKKESKLDFFDMYNEAIVNAREAGYKLYNIMTQFSDINEQYSEIKLLEKKGDRYLHDFFERLENAFITPMDRDIMGAMMRSIDDITDNIEHATGKLMIFHVKAVTPEAVEMTQAINNCVAALVEATVEFRNYKKSTKLRELIIEVNRLEEEGDCLYRNALSNLFPQNGDVTPADILNVIRWKDIYSDLEDVIDACEDVADYMESMLLTVS